MVPHRFAVALWESPHGICTAALAENPEIAAVAATPDEALAQIQEVLAWLYEEQPGREGPELGEARLARVRVRLRPEHRAEGRVYPADPVVLTLPCLYGPTPGELWLASLPWLEVRFYFHDPRQVRELAAHYGRERLRGLSPAEMVPFLSPFSFHLAEVVLRPPRPAPRHLSEPDLPLLSSVAEPVGSRAFRRGLARPYGREQEVDELVRRLGSERTSVLLVGRSGAGKTAVLAEAVRRLERSPGPQGSLRHRVWMTSGGRLIAGMKYLGQWQQRCEHLVEELQRAGGVLAVENLLELVRLGGGGPAGSLAAFLAPYLERGELQMVAEATRDELEACRRLLPGLADLFSVLVLADFDAAAAAAVMEQLAGALEQQNRVSLAPGAAELARRLHARFLPYEAFPGRASAFLREVVEQARLEGRPEVDRARVVEEFSRRTGLPELFLRDELPLNPEEVLAAFGAEILAQEEACRAAVRVLCSFKAGLNDPQRPLAVLLFCGPTGVGKTETARALARYLFGHGPREDRLIRLDMSEYSGPGAAARLLGSDGRPSELVRRLRQQPFAVVLFDEIEKAAPEVFDVLLNVFDEGRLCDAFGRPTLFRSAILIMTSNLGAQALRAIGLRAQPPPPYEAEAAAFFRPEFFNRIDQVVTFQPLPAEVVCTLVRRELAALEKREGLERAGLKLRCSEALVEEVGRQGYDARLGARPLQRAVERLVVGPLARFLVAHPGLRRTTLELDWRQGELVISPL
jgi:ATP-dependent Clp protease ATP-binding subunit ClpC